MIHQTPQELAARTNLSKPLGATKVYPQDVYPLYLVAVSKTGRKITLASIDQAKYEELKGIAPAWYTGPFPVWDYTIEGADCWAFANMASQVEAFWSSKRQCYLIGGSTPVFVGTARYHRDYSL